MYRPRRGLKRRGHCQKRSRDATLENAVYCWFSAPGAVDRRPHPRQRPGARPEPLFLLHFSYVPFHLETGEPFHVAREVHIRSHALHFVGGGIRRPVLDDLIARFLLGVEARIDVLLGCGPAAAVPALSASAQAFSSASLRACSSSAASRWRASATCAPELKFCVYAVIAAISIPDLRVTGSLFEVA